MIVGNLGDLITFEVSSEKVLTFKDLNRTISGRWAKHDTIGYRPISEFLGPDLKKITFTIQLNAMLGVKPSKVLDAIGKAVELGTPMMFVLGGRRIGSQLWVIESSSETYGEIIRDGKLASASVNLTLSEYTEHPH